MGIQSDANDKYLNEMESLVCFFVDADDERIEGGEDDGVFLRICRENGLLARARELLGRKEPTGPPEK